MGPTISPTHKLSKKDIKKENMIKQPLTTSDMPTSDMPTSDMPTYRMLKTLKPDVYELYGKDGEDLQKVGIALVQTLEASHKILEWTKKNSLLKVNCKYNDRFQKWEPISLSDDELSQINL